MEQAKVKLEEKEEITPKYGLKGEGEEEEEEEEEEDISPTKLCYAAESRTGNKFFHRIYDTKEGKRFTEQKYGLGITPLHRAAFRGHVQVVKSLLERKAPIWCWDHAGATPLHACVEGLNYAVENKLLDSVSSHHEQVAKCLLLAKADPHYVPQTYAESPIQCAHNNGLTGLLRLFMGRHYATCDGGSALRMAEEIIDEVCRAETIIAIREACGLLARVNVVQCPKLIPRPLEEEGEDPAYAPSGGLKEIHLTEEQAGEIEKRTSAAQLEEERAEEGIRNAAGADSGQTSPRNEGNEGKEAHGRHPVVYEGEFWTKDGPDDPTYAHARDAPVRSLDEAGTWALENVRMPSYCEPHHSVLLPHTRTQPYYSGTKKAEILEKAWRYKVLGVPKTSRLRMELEAL